MIIQKVQKNQAQIWFCFQMIFMEEFVFQLVKKFFLNNTQQRKHKFHRQADFYLLLFSPNSKRFLNEIFARDLILFFPSHY